MKKLLQLLLTCYFAVIIFAQAGSTDKSFNVADTGNGYGDGPASIVNQTIKLSDGKFLICGNFTSYSGITVNRIAKINSDGSLDTSFNIGSGANAAINSMALQSDGKIIIAGSFTIFNGTTLNRIARINTDGSIDSSFNIGTGASGLINSIALQSDGKIIAGGSFTLYNDDDAYRIVRLNTNGSRDTTFDTSVGAGGTNGPTVSSIAIDSGGKILISGGFTTYNGTTVGRIARLNTDATLDTSFNTGTGSNTSVLFIGLQDDHKILIGGNFATINGVAANQIARLNTDGSIDTSFVTTGATGGVYFIKQIDNKLLIGGNFTTYNGLAVNRLARLNLDGSLDTDFNFGNSGANGSINCINNLSDGSLFISGSFGAYNGRIKNYLTKLLSNGDNDNSFNTGTGTDKEVNAVAVQPDQKIVFAGAFSTYNSVYTNTLGRVNTDGTLDTTFNAGAGANVAINTLKIQPDGKLLIGGNFTTYNSSSANRITRINTDGGLDASFNIEGAGATGYVYGIGLQSDQKIIIGGAFTSYNGTTTNRLARLNTDGSLDTSFNIGTGAASGINALAVQNDDKIIIAGGFATYNGTESKNIARITASGSLDTSFVVGTGANFAVNAVALQSNGKVIIGGNFTTYNGTAAVRVARLNTDGSLDTTFNSAVGADGIVNSIIIQGDGKILIGGEFNNYNGTSRSKFARLNSDGTLDTTLIINSGANNKVNSIAIQKDEKIIIGGTFTNFNGVGKNRLARINGNDEVLYVDNSINRKNKINIYPNPVESILYVKTDKYLKSVDVYDQLGRKVLTENKKDINVNQLSKGIYILKIVTTDNIIKSEIIIKK